jgi:lipopolysaccharide biosynthesis glycosyltransferase
MKLKMQEIKVEDKKQWERYEESDHSTIELFLTITGGFMKFAAVTILSVLENTSKRVNFNILCTDISDNDRSMIGSMVGRFNAGIEFIIISDEQWELLRGAKISHFRLVSKPIGYVRFLIPHICKAKKALYMDADMVAVDDISPLWDVDFTRNGKEYAFAAAKGGAWKKWNLQFELPENHPHIDAGILLFNCAKWREDNMFDQLMDIAKRTHYDVISRDDQCTLNIWEFQNGGHAEFRYEYNVMANDWAPENLKILHYIVAKPWSDPFCKYAHEWWNVAMRTPYHADFMKMLHKGMDNMNIYQKDYNILTSCLEILKVRYTNDFSNRYFNEHLHPYSLLGISQMLSDYGINNEGIKIEDKETDIFNIECPFIAHTEDDFVLVYSVETDKVHYIRNGEKISVPVSQFIQTWSGIVLLMEATPNSIEPGYEEHRKQALLNDEEVIELFLTITGNFMQYAAVTILSVLENTSRRLNISILCSEVSDDDRDMIGSIVKKFNANVEFIIISDALWDLLHGVKVNQFASVGKPIGYVRFLIPHICKGKKALYMDADMIAVGDIFPLWDVSFIRDGKEHSFASAIGGAWKERNLRLGLPEDYPHINAGILLFNCAKWRKDKMFDQLMEIAKRTHYDVIVHDDQCTLNVCSFQNGGQIEFGHEYNVIANGWIPSNLKILHYLEAKPWNDPYCKHAHNWWDVARRTPYYERFLMEMLRSQR